MTTKMVGDDNKDVKSKQVFPPTVQESLVDTKHCRICNKCIDGFDHHCVWLNNCIAARNYRPFLVTLSTGFIIVTLFTIFMFVLFVMFFAARDQLCYLDCSSSNSTEHLRLFGARVSDPVFPIITGIIILPSVIVDALLGHLLGFHIYFITKGITTYDHFVRIKSQNQKHPFLFCICPKKSNKIAPAENDLQNGDGWLATLDNHLMGSQDLISPSHDPDTRSHDPDTRSHDLESASHDPADESHHT
ncbi:palmitoyltransferase ZDHHC11-like [Dysidea avara]|uniref:palmitoyltransferase ZDHHC11-like n=1 Tax=Dysidea avara TaxID=196820 RepID=UPI0033177044